MTDISTLDQLKDMAIGITLTENVVAFRPRENTKIIFNPNVDPEMEHCFCSNAGIVSFVVDGTMYVIPYMSSVMKVLKSEGFVRKAMYVPFSNNEYPLSHTEKWEELNTLAKLDMEERFVSDCIKYSDKHGYGEIAESLLSENCIVMPEGGLHVSLPSSNRVKIYYPEITGLSFSSSVTSTIGKYCVENGVCAFVYRTGKTYITKSSRVISALQSAGYRLGNISIPLVNGEIITDPVFAEKWNTMS